MIRSCVHSKVGVSVVDPKGELWPCCKYQRDSDNPLPTIFDVDTLDKLHNNSPYEKIKFDIENNIDINNNEFYVSLCFNKMIEDEYKVYVYDKVKTFCQWGTPEDLNDFFYYYKIFS